MVRRILRNIGKVSMKSDTPYVNLFPDPHCFRHNANSCRKVSPPIFCRKLVKFGEIYLSVYCLDYLTYPHLGPVAGAVVPLDAVVVPGVQDGQAGLHSDARPLEEIFSIVRLSDLVGHEL